MRRRRLTERRLDMLRRIAARISPNPLDTPRRWALIWLGTPAPNGDLPATPHSTSLNRPSFPPPAAWALAAISRPSKVAPILLSSKRRKDVFQSARLDKDISGNSQNFAATWQT